jgi:hypothetical protein
MSAVLAEAVNVAFPIVAAGAGATAAGVAEAGGAQIFQAVGRLLAKIRHRLGEGEVTKVELLQAFEAGLAAGEITEHELTTLVEIGRGARTATGPIDAKNVFIDTAISSQRDINIG